MKLLPWQTTTFQAIMQACAEQHLASAVGLTSEPGWAQDVLLDSIVKGLLEIEDDRPGSDIAHRDLWWKIPERENKGKAEFVISLVREINEFAVRKPQTAPRKVIVVENAHRLNRNAANALLKTLEEPPPDTHILVSSEYWGRLIPTIRSRCQRYTVRPDPAAARSWLEAQGAAVNNELFAQLGHAPIPASRAQNSALIGEWVESLERAPLNRAVAEAMEGDVADWLARWFRYVNTLLAASHDNSATEASTQQVDLLLFAEQIISARRQIMTSNSANTRAMLEMLVVRWTRAR